MNPLAAHAHITDLVTPNLSAKNANSVAANTRMVTPITLPNAPMSTDVNPRPPYIRDVAIQIGVASAPAMTTNVHPTWLITARLMMRSFRQSDLSAPSPSSTRAYPPRTGVGPPSSSSWSSTSSPLSTSILPPLAALTGLNSATDSPPSTLGLKLDKSPRFSTSIGRRVSPPPCTPTVVISTSPAPTAFSTSALSTSASWTPTYFGSSTLKCNHAYPQRNAAAANTHPALSANGYSLRVPYGQWVNTSPLFGSRAFGSPPHGYASTAESVGPIVLPSP
mmetsp:Transcript_397/g.1856  ORF Transcript_397/g.1856 Transcript_397/m.1856 type:complete len:278 (-) Transcript_397:549-1382(-)